jgi:hypothetical protein
VRVIISVIKAAPESNRNTALMGMALSHKPPHLTVIEWWTESQVAKAEKRAAKLAHLGGGHNKFLRQVETTWLIRAPRHWWSQFDTYQVGTTRQSESTMHTLAKHPPKRTDFADDTPWATFAVFWVQWHLHRKDINRLKSALPEGYLQTRMVTMNYMTLQNIIAQRKGHRLGAWAEFIDKVLKQVNRPQWLVKGGSL